MKIKTITKAKNGINKDTANEIFDHIARFASYGFNKSHAAAYASISFQTASLKAHHPESFYAASMNLAIGKVEDIAIFSGELKTRKIKLLTPDVNTSFDRFRPLKVNGTLAISYGMAALRGVGVSCSQDIVAERENGEFTNLENFRERMGSRVNKKALTSLIYAGAFDQMIYSRRDAIALAQDKNMISANQMSFFDDPEIDTREHLEEFGIVEKLNHEFDVMGFWHSGHPLGQQVQGIKQSGLTSLRTLRNKTKLPKVAWIVGGVINSDVRGTKSGGVMGLVTISDSIDVYEAVAFDDVWAGIRQICKKKEMVALQVVPREEGGIIRLMIQKAVPLENYVARKAA